MFASTSMMLAGGTHATVIGFDDVITGGDFNSLSDASPYASLSWGEGWFAGDNGIDGYANAAHSGANFAVNGFGDDQISVSSATGFNFAGAWFVTPEGASDKAGWINITAFDALNRLIGTTGNIAVGDSYQWVAGGFANVAMLTITRDSGWYVMDDFTTTVAPGTVPVPATPLVLVIGLLAMVLVRRMRS
ncbi:hypothetical protein C5614_04150 [Massilia phosphatilytica]|nr:hypothetical protein C5614_04150 [Massilia phosphatilytica]